MFKIVKYSILAFVVIFVLNFIYMVIVFDAAAGDTALFAVSLGFASNDVDSLVKISMKIQAVLIFAILFGTVIGFIGLIRKYLQYKIKELGQKMTEDNK
jgi:hypothetical protein